MTDEAAARRIEELERELQRQMVEIDTLLRVIPIGISIARDPRCRVVTNNRFQAELMGHAPNENASIDREAPDRQTSYLVFRGSEAMDADDLPLHRALREKREVLDVEFDAVVHGERRVSMIGHGAPIFDESGELRGAVAAFVDVTARKRAEDALRESERRFRLLTEAIPHVVWTAAPNGDVTYVNARWREYTGRATFDALGWGWEQVLSPDDRPICHARWLKALASGEAFEVETRVRRHDGQWRWHLLRALPLAADGQPVTQWFGTMTDIDAQKRVEHERENLLVLEKVARTEAELSQRRAKLLDDAMRSLSSSMDYDAALATIPRLALGELGDVAVLEVLEQDDCVRRVVHGSQLVPDRKLKRLEEALAAAAPRTLCAMTGGSSEFEPNVDQSWIVRTSLGPEHRAAVADLKPESILSVALEVRGRVLGALTLTFCFGRRHTRAELSLAEQLAARAALAVDNTRLYREAQDANAAKDRFLAAVSHELRTPLNAILGWTRVLRRGAVRAEVATKALDIIERNANMQSRLVEDVLDISRAATGNFSLARRRMNVAEVVRETIEMLAPAAEERRVGLDLAADGEGCDMEGDPQRMQQVAWNLVVNAIKFSPEGGRVAVRVAREDGAIRLEVADQGEGIAAEFVPYLFRPFHQATRAHGRGGLGLGLAIVRHIVDGHGGTVAAHSDGPGLGARFTVVLPVEARG
jgi:PAS domain S-box-containing protein